MEDIEIKRRLLVDASGNQLNVLIQIRHTKMYVCTINEDDNTQNAVIIQISTNQAFDVNSTLTMSTRGTGLTKIWDSEIGKYQNLGVEGGRKNLIDTSRQIWIRVLANAAPGTQTALNIIAYD